MRISFYCPQFPRKLIKDEFSCNHLKENYTGIRVRLPLWGYLLFDNYSNASCEVEKLFWRVYMGQLKAIGGGEGWEIWLLVSMDPNPYITLTPILHISEGGEIWPDATIGYFIRLSKRKQLLLESMRACCQCLMCLAMYGRMQLRKFTLTSSQ